MLAAWLQEHKESVNCAKLWLFDNKLTDLGAKSVTNMMHDGEERAQTVPAKHQMSLTVKELLLVKFAFSLLACLMVK